MSLANAIALTAQRMATNGGNEIPAVPSRSSARAIGSPTTSPATISLPKRGVWPPNTMSPSDFSDNTLEYRSGGMRSPAFPWPQPITNNTATPAQTAAESATAITTWNRNKVYNPGDVVVFANSPGGIYQCVSQNKNTTAPGFEYRCCCPSMGADWRGNNTVFGSIRVWCSGCKQRG